MTASMGAAARAAVVAGVAVAGAAGAYLAYQAYFAPKLSLTVDGFAGSVTINEGDKPIWAMQGKPGDPVQIWWSLQSSDIVGGPGSGEPFTGTLDSNGDLSWSGNAIVSPTGSYPGTFYVQAYDPTTGDLSNVLTVTVDQASSGCTAPSFECYQSDACCPPGDVCPNSSGNCPSGYAADPDNPGCCVSSTPHQQVPTYWVYDDNPNASGSYCQPVYDSLLAGWQCCGSPSSTKPNVSIVLQVLDQNRQPITGVTVLYQVEPGNPYTLTFDAASYQTDQYGQIYPDATVDWLPTDCNPSDQGTLYGQTCNVTFYVEGAGGAATAPVSISATIQFRVATNGGLCGSC
jgi:hypothetical protein